MNFVKELITKNKNSHRFWFFHFENNYFFTIIFHLAIKFGLTEEFNEKKYVLINYDDEETYVLGYTNPFKEEDSRYYSFVKIREDGIKNYKEYHKYPKL